MAQIPATVFLKRLGVLFRNPATYFWLLVALLLATILTIKQLESLTFVAVHKTEIVLIPLFSLIIFVAAYFAIKIIPSLSGLLAPNLPQPDPAWQQLRDIVAQNQTQAEIPSNESSEPGFSRSPEDQKTIEEIYEIFKPCIDSITSIRYSNPTPEQRVAYENSFREAMDKLSRVQNANEHVLKFPGVIRRFPCSALPGADPQATGEREIGINVKGDYPAVFNRNHLDIILNLTPRYTLLWCGRQEALETEHVFKGLNQIIPTLASLGVLVAFHYTDNPDQLPLMAPECHQLLEHHQALAGFFLIEKRQVIHFWFGQEAFPGLLVWLRGQTS